MMKDLIVGLYQVIKNSWTQLGAASGVIFVTGILQIDPELMPGSLEVLGIWGEQSLFLGAVT